MYVYESNVKRDKFTNSFARRTLATGSTASGWRWKRRLRKSIRWRWRSWKWRRRGNRSKRRTSWMKLRKWMGEEGREEKADGMGRE